MDTGGLITNSNEFEVSVTPVNDPPFWEEIIPDLKLDEDTSKEAWLDLDNFGADIEENFLDYKLLSQSDQVNISININAENEITIIPKPNYFGTSNATIQVFESGNKEFYANYTFDINVLPINDPPVISPVSDQNVNEDHWLNFTITASDPDFDVNFTFKSNITRTNFYFEPYSGKLSFHPTNDDVGELFVNISVEDEGALKDYDEFKITITNVNDPPTDSVIASPKDETKFKTNELVEFQAGICQDIDIGDTITYSWDFDFIDGIQKEKLGQNVNHTYDLPGRYKVTLTISDGTIQKSTFIVINITSTSPTNGGGETNGNGDGSKDSDYFLIAMIVVIIIIILVLVISGFLLLRKKRKSILNKYIDEIDQAYDWARTNPTVGKEKLSNLKIKLSGDFKDGRLEREDYRLLEDKLHDYMRLLGMTIPQFAHPEIAKPIHGSAVATAQKVTPVQPTLEQKFNSSTQQPIKTTTPPSIPQPTQPRTAPTTMQHSNHKPELVKCFNCGNYISVTPTPPGQPTFVHCPKCGQDGTM
jgi:PKD repeat protein